MALTANPPSGLYFYEVVIEGIEEAGQPVANETSFGVQDDENSQET